MRILFDYSLSDQVSNSHNTEQISSYSVSGAVSVWLYTAALLFTYNEQLFSIRSVLLSANTSISKIYQITN